MKATVVAMIPSSRAGTPRRKYLANCLALALCLSGSTGFAGKPTSGNGGRTLGDSIVVTNCNDSGAGSLRAAVDGAPNDSTIDKSNLTCGIIALEDPLFIDQTDLDLMGSSVSGIPTPTIEAAAGNTDGLLRHNGTGSLDLNDLTIAGGAKYYDASTTGKYARGGCIFSNGSVYVSDSKVKYCSATNAGAGSAAGGAIYAAGDVTLSRSSLYSNSVFATEAANGGGVVAKGQFSMFSSTLRDNDATSSGGLARAGGAWASDGGYITHSTISGNTEPLPIRNESEGALVFPT